MMKTLDVDLLAQFLGRMGAAARVLSPSGVHGDTYPLAVCDSMAQIGTIVPGVGLVLDTSLKRLGITRPIPHVIERSLLERTHEWARYHWPSAIAAAAACTALAVHRNDLSALPMLAATLSSMDSIVNAIGAGRAHLVLWNTGVQNYSTTNVNIWSFQHSVHNPVPLSLSTALSSTAPSDATSGAITSYLPALSGSEQRVLTAVHELSQLPASIIATFRVHVLVDLLYECGGIDFNTNTLQTLGTSALTRYTSGVGVQLVMVQTASSSNVNKTITFKYTNSDGTASRTASTPHSSNLYGTVSQLYPTPTSSTPMFPQLNLQAGDIGVRSVETAQWSASSGTGTFAALLYKPLAVLVGTRFGRIGSSDFLDRMQPLVLQSGACLTMMHHLGADGSFRNVGSSFGFKFIHV